MLVEAPRLIYANRGLHGANRAWELQAVWTGVAVSEAPRPTPDIRSVMVQMGIYTYNLLYKGSLCESCV